jgi:Domain of unknown function (DUF3859)
VLASTLLAASLVPVAAQEVTGIAILERGIYTLEVTKTDRTPSGVDQATVTNICRVANTATVPAAPGVQFGMRFRVDGPTSGMSVQIMIVVHFPKVVTPPGGPRALSVYANTSMVKVGQVSYWGYGLDHPWEIMPGTWTFEMFGDGRKLAEVAFEVVAGMDSPNQQSDGRDCFQVSDFRRVTPRAS